jgi:hypothetical protein
VVRQGERGSCPNPGTLLRVPCSSFRKTVLRFGYLHFLPSLTTLSSRSIWNKQSNSIPVLAAVLLYCTLKLCVFIFCPFTPFSIRLVHAASQEIMPSILTLYFRSTRNQPTYCAPIIASSVFSYCILQLDVFVFFPLTRASSHLIDNRFQSFVPSILTLNSRSTWNQRGKFDPILEPMLMYRFFQLHIFEFLPFTSPRLKA